ncbi:MAG: hypothetical protein V3R61_03360, partial [candidate division NC10 bacterium]
YHGASGRPPPPALRSPKAFGAANQVPPSPGPAPLALPKRPHSAEELYFVLRQHLQASTDIAGSGGAPRLATAWDTEARSVPIVCARSVNTEGPRP